MNTDIHGPMKENIPRELIEEGKIWGPGKIKTPTVGGKSQIHISFDSEAVDQIVNALKDQLVKSLVKNGNAYIKYVAEETRTYASAMYSRFTRYRIAGVRQERSVVLGKRAGAEVPARKGREYKMAGEILKDKIAVFPAGGKSYTIAIMAGHYLGDTKGSKIGVFRRGVPLQLLAYWVENGQQVVWPITTRMLAYIMAALKPNKRGYGSRRKPNQNPIQNNKPTGKMIRFNYPKLPVWSQTLKFMLKHLSTTLPKFIYDCLAEAGMDVSAAAGSRGSKLGGGSAPTAKAFSNEDRGPVD
jgi:hypothetical protein